MKKIIFLNLIIFLIFIAFFFICTLIINSQISGQPRYWEIVHKKNHQNVRENKEKIIQLKNKNKISENYFSIFDESYKKLNYSGEYKIGNCGSIENGNDELIYQADKHGFRENQEYRYILSDYILLGDSFTQSICENKPNDLKSLLLKKTNFSYLNLGMEGTDYAEQALNLKHYTTKTNFKGLIWLFYEGNDYEQTSNKVKKIRENFGNQIKKYDAKYQLDINHKITILFKFKVWFAEFIRGPSVLLKFFKNYDNLLDKEDYNKVLKNVQIYLDKKNTKKRFLIYIPSWQKISLYKLKKFKIYDSHPQITQLNKLKEDVRLIAEDNNFIFIDGDDYFIDRKKPLDVFHYKLNTHFNKKGNLILAELISSSLINNLKSKK